MKFTIQVEIDTARVRALLINALEGGSNYWYQIESHEFPFEEIVYADFKQGGRFNPDDEPWNPRYLIPFTPGCATVFSAEGQEARFRLCVETIAKGLVVMAEKYPQHWADFVTDNDDATTGDVFLQCCLFGELVYG